MRPDRETIVILAIPVGLAISVVLVVCGVVGLATLTGLSRDRDLEREGWKGVRRW